MELDKIVVLFAGLGSIGGIAWFFFANKAASDAVSVEESITIEVSGGYRPSAIALQKGKKTTISFHRTDPSSCLEEVVLPDFKIKQFLPLNKTVSVEIVPQKIGEFPFACSMNMYHGKIIVRK